MDVLFWEYPSGLDDPRGEVTSSIVQSGIKLFLHQRNQIPLPLEQLGARLALSRSQDQQEQPNEEGEPRDLNSNMETDNPRERIQKMLMKRKEMTKEKKLMKKGLKTSRQEEMAQQMITNILQTLDTSIIKIFDSLLAVSLIFGSSVQSPKEIIVFEIPSFQKVVLKAQENIHRPLDMVTLVRSFYRTIIMSEQFVELTSKSLNPTGTHVCLFSRTELPEELRQDLILVESTSFLSQLLTEQQWSLSGKSHLRVQVRLDVSRTKKKVKVLRIKFGKNIDSGGGDGRMSMEEDLSLNDSEDNEENSEQVEDRDDFLLESNSFCCYQIPLRFKGVRCKNKG